MSVIIVVLKCPEGRAMQFLRCTQHIGSVCGEISSPAVALPGGDASGDERLDSDREGGFLQPCEEAAKPSSPVS